MSRRFLHLPVALLCVTVAAFAQIHPPKPGWNLFSPGQDVKLGREAAAEVEHKMPIVRNPELERYISTLGQRLARSRYAGDFPFTFKVVASKEINAFSLPGGPVYLNTGVIAAADNEAQLAGIIAHEMSHIALRHATNQASKAEFIRLPAILAGAVAGGTILGSLASAGIGLGANSVLLKFSRSAEAQADYNGALIMADAGYNPMELARFFEKLEAKYGNSIQFLSDHPNPGNRVRAIEEELQQMPQQSYRTDSGEFQRIKDQVLHLPGPRELRSSYQDEHTTRDTVPSIRPSRRLREYSGAAYSLSYPENWESFADRNSLTATIAPREGIVRTANGGTQIGYGLTISYYQPPGETLDLRRDTDALIRELKRQNSGAQVTDQRETRVDGHPGLLTILSARSPFEGETEVDAIVTVPQPDGLFYLAFTAPQSEWSAVQPVFDEIVRSIRLHS